MITVLIILFPLSMRPQLLYRSHNDPNAGHQATDKTLNRLQEETYWVLVEMVSDVEKHCK